MNREVLATFGGRLDGVTPRLFYPILFSGRGYWQELIESIVWAHNKLKVAPNIQPRALSITQGRAVGVAHYLLGGIATTWSFFLARIIAVG